MGPTYRRSHDHQPSGPIWFCLLDPAWSFSLGFTSSKKPSLLLLEDPASLEIKDHLANWAQSSVPTKVWHHEHCPKEGSLLPVTTQPCPTTSQTGSDLAPSSSYRQALACQPEPLSYSQPCHPHSGIRVTHRASTPPPAHTAGIHGTLTCPGLLPVGSSSAKAKLGPLRGKMGDGNQGVLNSARPSSHTDREGLQKRISEGHAQVGWGRGDNTTLTTDYTQHDTTHPWTDQQSCSPDSETEQPMRAADLLVPGGHGPEVRWSLLCMPVGLEKPLT